MRFFAAALGWVCAVALALVVRRLRLRLELVARAEHELRGPLTAFGLALHAARGTPAGRRLGVLLEAELARARAGLDDLAAARTGRAPAGRGPAAAPVGVETLLRSSGAAWDLAARARGRRLLMRSRGIGSALVRGDRSRLAAALGNVMANAVEHGSGDVSVSAVRAGSRLRIEVTNAMAPPEAAEPEAVLDHVHGLSADASPHVPPPSRERGRGLRIAADAVAGAGGRLSSTIDGRRARTILDLPLER